MRQGAALQRLRCSAVVLAARYAAAQRGARRLDEKGAEAAMRVGILGRSKCRLLGAHQRSLELIRLRHTDQA